MSIPSGGLGPDFICVGAQKGGTQWLYDQLAFHPDFWMPPIKELHYFDRGTKKRIRIHRPKLKQDLSRLNAKRKLKAKPLIDDRGIEFIRNYIFLARRKEIDLDGYAHLFDAKGSDIAGDITGGYSKLNKALIASIAARFPTLKVVFIARDPVERVWSQLSMLVRKEKIELPITTASVVERVRSLPTIAGRSYPSKIVRRWRRYVPENRFGLFFFDDLCKDPADLRRRVVSFLGGDPGIGIGQVAPGFNRKDGLKKLVMTDEIRAALVKHFADELKACAHEMGGPAAEWPKKYAL